MSEASYRDVARRGLQPVVGHMPAAPTWDSIATQQVAPEKVRVRPWTVGFAVLAATASILALASLTGPKEPSTTPPSLGMPSSTSTIPPPTTGPTNGEPFHTATEIVSGIGWLSVELPHQVSAMHGAMVWTGSEILFWGGRDLNDQPAGDPGVAYSPATNTWRQIPQSSQSSLSTRATAWTGSEMIVCCDAGRAMAYNPDTDSWRTIDNAPALDGSPAVGVWTGTEVMVAAGQQVIAYNPDSESWREFPRPQSLSLGRLKKMVWTGTSLIVWPADAVRRVAQGQELDPDTGVWTVLPDPPALPAAPDVVWTGEDLIIWGGLPAEGETSSGRAVGSRYNPTTKTWVAMAEALPEPVPPSREGNLGSQTLLWTGEDLLVSTGFLSSGLSRDSLLLSYDPSSDEWAMIGVSPVHGHNYSDAVMADGSAVLRWSGTIYISPTHPWMTRPLPQTNDPRESPPRRDHVSIWTGEEVLIYGGCCDLGNTGPTASGLAWNPATGSWRDLPESPVNVDLWWKKAAVWTGNEMVVAGRPGGAHGTIQLYSPEHDTWRIAPARPTNSMAIGATAWTGSEVLFVGGDHLFPSGEAWAYDPTNDSWREMPDAGIPDVEYIEGVWTGTEAIFLYSAGLRYSGGAVAYNPSTDTWRELPDFQAGLDHGVALDGVAWTGSHLLVYDGRHAPGTGVGERLRIYDPQTESWSFGAPMPIIPRQGGAIAWAGDRLVVWGGRGWHGSVSDQDADDDFDNGATYDPVTDSWTMLPRSPLSARCGHTAVWTGDEVMVFGGWTNCVQIDSWGDHQAATYRPDRNEWTLLQRD